MSWQSAFDTIGTLAIHRASPMIEPAYSDEEL
jgi:hypothetical protein